MQRTADFSAVWSSATPRLLRILIFPSRSSVTTSRRPTGIRRAGISPGLVSADAEHVRSLRPPPTYQIWPLLLPPRLIGVELWFIRSKMNLPVTSHTVLVSGPLGGFYHFIFIIVGGGGSCHILNTRRTRFFYQFKKKTLHFFTYMKYIQIRMLKFTWFLFFVI